MRKRKWVYKDGTTVFEGFYERDKKDERIFVLIGPRGRRITTESWQMAIKSGWSHQE